MLESKKAMNEFQQTNVSNLIVRVERFPDGALCLECGHSRDMKADLIFASGGLEDDDPTYIKQSEILERIQLCINACSNFTSEELKDCLPGGNSEIGIKIGVCDE